MYQFDAVYRPAQEPDQALTIRIDGAGSARKSFNPDGDQLADHYATSIGIAYLEEGELDLELFGRFFVGARYLSVTPLPNDHEMSKMVMPPGADSQQEFAPENPSIARPPRS